MFDKRLMAMCPESKKYILGNILLQFLFCNNRIHNRLLFSVTDKFTINTTGMQEKKCIQLSMGVGQLSNQEGQELLLTFCATIRIEGG